MSKKKQSMKLSDVKLNYLTGKPVDNQTLKSCFSIFGSLIAMGVLFLIVGMALMMDSAFLRILLNGAVLLCALFMYFQMGSAKGGTAVNQGEIMYDRRQSGQLVSENDLRNCYHPAKGFLIGLLGSLPFIIIATILALTTSRQMTGLGALPSWLSAFQNRAEIGNALAYYYEPVALTVEDVTRVITRMMLMPVVNIFNLYDAEALLLMEHLSPLFLLLPGLAYGLGYTQGITLRKQVVIGIAEGEKKRKKKERRQQRQRTRAPKGPEQLN